MIEFKEIFKGAWFFTAPAEKDTFWQIAKQNDMFPVRYESEEKSFVREVKPLANHAHEMSSWSNREFPPHNEAPHRIDAPDFLSLHCVNEGNKPGLRIYSIEEIESYLSKETLLAMRAKDFRLNIGDSWGTHGHAKIRINLGDGRWQYHWENLKATNNTQAKILTAIRVAISRSKPFDVALKNNQGLLLDNFRTLHARSFFETDDEGRNRLLYRTYYKRFL